jgi:hypothetical protein
MKKILPFLALLLFSQGNLLAQKLNPSQQKQVDQLFAKNKTVYFTFPVSSFQEIGPLSKVISIEGNKGMVVSAHATKDQFTRFIVKNYAYKVVPAKRTAPKVVKKKAATKK